MREIILNFNNIDYFVFQKIANESGLTPTEKLQENGILSNSREKSTKIYTKNVGLML